MYIDTGTDSLPQACDSCRKRKRRCLWDQGAEKCTYCTQLKEECTTTYVRKARTKSQKRYVWFGSCSCFANVLSRSENESPSMNVGFRI